jgi:hypothetical protein
VSTDPLGELFGWIPQPAESERIMGMQPIPTMAEASWLKDAGRGKVVLLHKAFTSAGIPFPVRRQTIGDCVSQGWACAVDCLVAVQITKGERIRWTAECATEPIYAGSRVEISKGRLGRRDGSFGSAAAEFVKTFGAVPRGRYGDIDLTTYDGQRARAWGMPKAGVPDALEPKLREHPVQAFTLVQTYEQARDAIASGYPVPVASNQGFAMRRDEKGFARPKGNWGHQMCFIGVDDADARPGLLCMNSWGPDWIDGPTRHDQPPGSFWVDADVAERMLRQDDSHAASGYVGMPANNLPDFSQT